MAAKIAVFALVLLGSGACQDGGRPTPSGRNLSFGVERARAPYVLERGISGTRRNGLPAGVAYRAFDDPAGRSRVHAVDVELGVVSQSLLATSYAERGTTTSQFARAHDCAVAINGGFFTSSDFQSWGEAVGATGPWSAFGDTPLRGEANGFAALGSRAGTVSVTVTDPRDEAAAIEPWMSAVVAGDPLRSKRGKGDRWACPAGESLDARRDAG